jgi:HEPN domain-containing protein
MIKAKHDLYAAKKLGEDKGYIDVTIYHCQQAAEKALKGLLTLFDSDFSKTHDIRLLVQLAAKIKSEMQAFEESADLLTPYATEYRYPGEVMEPTNKEFSEALLKAEEIINFIITILPKEIQDELN